MKFKRLFFVLLITLLLTSQIRAADYYGQVIPVTIVSTTATQILPTASVGLRRVYTTDSNIVVMTVAPPSGKQIVWDRALLTADYKLISDGIAYATLYCEVIVANQWVCYPNSGAFTATAP